DTYPDEAFFPVNDIGQGTWFPGGFGTDNVPAIIVNTTLANGIAEDVEALNVIPYPNPTTDLITIPLGVAMNGSVNLTVFDVEGRMVLAEELCQKNSTNISVDVSGLSSGVHTFQLQFEDNSTTSFRVVITR
ncbi:MAG: T9SS type A sorting domain-containing protein, partial [Bacteroidetes bacterium]